MRAEGFFDFDLKEHFPHAEFFCAWSEGTAYTARRNQEYCVIVDERAMVAIFEPDYPCCLPFPVSVVSFASVEERQRFLAKAFANGEWRRPELDYPRPDRRGRYKHAG